MLQVIKSKEHLQELLNEGYNDFHIILNCGCISCKWIMYPYYTSVGGPFYLIEHCIDDTTEIYNTLEELLVVTNVGEAIEKGAFRVDTSEALDEPART